MAALTSQNIITMNINNLENIENTTTHSNVSFNANILNLHIVTLSDSNTILHENHINSPLENTTTTTTATTTTTTINTTQPRTRRVLPPSIVIVSSDDEEGDVANNINTIMQNKNDKDKKLKIGLKTSARSKSSLKKIKNVNNKLDNNSIDDERESSTKNITAPLAKKKLTIYTYEQLNIEKYKMDELRKLCMQYKVSRAGNKEEITKRLYDYCKNSIVPLKIQKVVRGFLHRKLIKLRGPAFEKRNICTNETDFFTMDEMHEIPYEQFYSYKDIDGFIYGFDLMSFYNLLNKTDGQIKNPYNRLPITNTVISDFNTLIRISKILKIQINVNIQDISAELSNAKNIELKTVALFQNIDALGNYSHPKWFMDLNRTQLIKMFREIIDIWSYRANLTNEIKRNICPPVGNPFPRIVNFHILQTTEDLDDVREYILNILEKIVLLGVDKDSKCLGAYYVLGALTLVSVDAANALPWLYQALIYI